jgi:hypothetical protein
MISALVVGLMVISLAMFRFAYHYQNRQWFGIDPYRMVVIPAGETAFDNFYLVQVLPGIAEAAVFALPGEALVDTGLSYGEYRVNSLLKLGKLEKKGDTLLLSGLGFSLGVNIDAVLEIKNLNSPDEINGTVIASWFRRHLIESAWGNGNIADALGLLKTGAGRTSQSHKVLDLHRETRLYQEEQIGEDKVLRLNKIMFDDLVKRTAAIKSPELANFPVALENAAQKAGLAGQWGKILKNEGFDVIGVGDSNDPEALSLIRFESKEDAQSLAGRLLQKQFPGFSVDYGPLTEYRSKALVRFGPDYQELILN